MKQKMQTPFTIGYPESKWLEILLIKKTWEKIAGIYLQMLKITRQKRNRKTHVLNKYFH